MRKFFEKIVEGGLLISGSVSSFTILLIVFFLFKEAGGLFNTPATEEGYVLAVNKSNDVGKLSPEKIMDIFDGNITNWKDISGMDQDILIFRFSDLTNYYTEEELGDEFQYVPQKISELVAKEPGIIAFFPKQYLLENDFQGKVLPEEKIRPYLMEADKRGLLAPFYLELTTGLRRGELLALLWTDLDVEKRTISITKQVTRTKGELVVSQPKTHNSIRVLPVSQQAVELLVEEHKKHPGNPYMFPSPKTGGMFDPDSFRHTHEKILKAIGTEHIRFHDLRHTFATLTLKNGVDVKTLSSTLGHYSAGFTLSTYTHATPDMMREAADTMGDVIGKAI